VNSLQHLITLAVVLVAFACGWGVASQSSAESPAQASASSADPDGPSTAPEPEHARAVSAPSSAAATSDRSDASVSLRQLLGASGRVAHLRSTLDQLDPEEEPWPDEVPDDLQPEAFENHILDILDEMGFGAIDELDCVEYPCVATLAAYDDDEEVPSDVMDLADLMDIRMELEQRLGMPIDAHINTSPYGSWLSLAAHPEDISGPRLTQRLETAWTDAAQ